MLTNNYNLYQKIINFMALKRERGDKAGGNSINIDLQLNLLNTWTRFKVGEYYQNIVLTHLDEHDSKQVEEHIKKEIKLTLQRKSPYFQLQKLEQERKHLLIQLQQKLDTQKSIDDSQALQGFCSDLKQLREINLLTAEQILKIYNIYRCSTPQAIEKQMEYYDSILEQLDQDNHFLKESFLNQYIKFDDGYDPFLMAQYENIHRNKMSHLETPVKELYSMNISYAYRLMKTKNIILELRSMAKRKQIFDDQINTSYRFHQKKDNTKSQFYPPKKQSIAKNEILPTERMTLKDNESLRIKPIQVYPSPNAKSNHQIAPKLASLQPSHQVHKLKFAKVQPANESRSSSQPFPSVHKQPRYFLDSKAYGLESSIVKEINVFDKRKSLSRAPSLSVEPEKRVSGEQKQRGKYKVGIGEIYQASHLTPIKSHKLRTEPNQPQRTYDLDLKKLKEKNLQFISEQSNRAKMFSIPKRNKNASQQIESEESDGSECGPSPSLKKVRYYNPVKKQEFSIQDAIDPRKKYDYHPQTTNLYSKTAEANRYSKRQEGGVDQQEGLLYELPLTKYNLRPKKTVHLTERKLYPNFTGKKTQKQIQNTSNHTGQSPHSLNKTIVLVNQQAQTTDFNNINKSSIMNSQSKKTPLYLNNNNGMQQNQNKTSKFQPQHLNNNSFQKSPAENKPSKESQHNNTAVNRQSYSPQALKTNDPVQQKLQTPQNQQIIDRRPQANHGMIPEQNAPNKKEEGKMIQAQDGLGSSSKNSSLRRSYNESHVNGTQGDKKQIRIKVGKSNLHEVIALLDKIKLSQKYKQSFQIGKITQWIKLSQTYLVQFHFNQQPAIVALCSPIPNVGIALKLWAPITPNINDPVISTLFAKYLQYIEKNTTADKIVFSGKPFPQLSTAGFVMKKDNLYQRTRKLPPKQSEAEFKPFLYIQCSNIRFEHKGQQKILFSEQIQEFSPPNSYSASFLAEIDPTKVPQHIFSLFKHTPKLADFKGVNQILMQEDFDTYEAEELSIAGIDLMRFYLNSPLKSTFIAQDGYLKLTGTLVHDRASECIVSVPIMKNNGRVFFCKGLVWASILDLIKTPSTAKTQFSVMMFSKKLYGKMPDSPRGCYGNWEINLTWEDELQGRVRHSMVEMKNFGPKEFKVVIQLQGQVILGFQATQKDSIL